MSAGIDTVPLIPGLGATSAQTAQQQEPASDIAALPAATRNDFVERAWRFCCSTKLMVVLMALFALGMAAGTFLNPKDDALENIERAFANRPAILWAYHTFELYAPFKSWWFTSLILALALNNLASSIERLPRIFLIVRNPQKRLTDFVLRGLRNRKTVAKGDLTPEGVQAGFERAGYRTTAITEDGTTWLFGERGAWTRFGVWVVHIALLIICFGGLAGRLFAFEGTMEIPDDGGVESAFLERMPDGTVLTHPLSFQIKCNRFHLDKFKDGSARRFESDLTVLDLAGNPLYSKHVIVNDPLVWDGMDFYQATYSERPDMSHATMSITDLKTGQSQEVRATSDQSFSFDEDHVRYTVANYEENFGELGPAVQVVREAGPFQADGTSLNPAATSSFWVFKNYPDFDGKYRGDAYGLKFDGLEPGYATGIQVARDPGRPWIYLGCVLMWIGLFTTFWTVHRRVWARFEGDKVVFAGAAHRNKEKFRDEFEAFLSKLGVTAKDA